MEWTSWGAFQPQAEDLVHFMNYLWDGTILHVLPNDHTYLMGIKPTDCFKHASTLKKETTDHTVSVPLGSASSREGLKIHNKWKQTQFFCLIYIMMLCVRTISHSKPSNPVCKLSQTNTWVFVLKIRSNPLVLQGKMCSVKHTASFNGCYCSEHTNSD